MRTILQWAILLATSIVLELSILTAVNQTSHNFPTLLFHFQLLQQQRVQRFF